MSIESRARRTLRRGWRTAGGLAAAALIAACGGGTSQYEAFQAGRLFAFGDELSALTGDGHSYSVNGLSDNGTAEDASDDVFNCRAFPNWVQSLAAIYGFVFAECNPDNIANPRARSYAAEFARVSDVEAQVEAAVFDGGFQDRDLSTVLVGVNDILDLYARYDGTNEAALVAEAAALGERVARLVNRLVALGSKVIVSNLPDMGLSPYAINERAHNTDTDRAALISRLGAAFNEQLGVKILLNGRYIGLVQIDQRSQVMVRSPGSFSLVNVSEAACTVAPPACTTQTLATGATASTWMWASDRWFAPGAMVQLAGMAIDRAQRNPF